VQVCCSSRGFAADPRIAPGDIVSHDAISRRGNNHAARKTHMDILAIVLWRQPSLSVLGLPPQQSRQSPRVLQTSRRKRVDDLDHTAISADDRPLQYDRWVDGRCRATAMRDVCACPPVEPSTTVELGRARPSCDDRSIQYGVPSTQYHSDVHSRLPQLPTVHQRNGRSRRFTWRALHLYEVARLQPPPESPPATGC
jgi:hypothetical protein